MAHVRIHHEKKVAEYLGKMGIETFVPVQQEIHQWSDRRKLVETVLLPMMVFVHADPKERMAALTLATVSRYMVLRGEGKPAVIPDDQMARFRFMLDELFSISSWKESSCYQRSFDGTGWRTSCVRWQK